MARCRLMGCSLMTWVVSGCSSSGEEDGGGITWAVHTDTPRLFRFNARTTRKDPRRDEHNDSFVELPNFTRAAGRMLSVLGLALCVSCSNDETPSRHSLAPGLDVAAMAGATAMPPPMTETSPALPASIDAGAAPSTPDAGQAAIDAGGVTDPSTSEGDAQTLSSTGLYENIGGETLAPGVLEYQPAYALWSDGSEKRRFVRLPDGQQIDSSNMNDWRFPVGTQLWKEFVRDGVRVETRLLEKRTDGLGILGWFGMAYAWNEEQTEAYLSRAGAENVLGTDHDVPGRLACRECHGGVADAVLGFSAVQLSHEDSGVTLQTLVEQDLLSDPPSSTLFVPPGDATAQAALGMLHANCGHCHNPGGAASERSDLELWLDVNALETVESTPAYQSAVDVPLNESIAEITLRIAPGAPALSGVIARMSSREDLVAMPPLATELVDEVGIGELEDWISGLAP